METFIDMLKARHLESKKRMEDAEQNARIAQSVFQAAAQECAGWQKALEAETRREQQLVPEAPKTVVVVESKKFTVEPAPPPPAEESPELNKTDLIRDLLAQHPGGITPPDLWKALAGKIVHRPYLYSVLKRLRDKKEVTHRRGKYYLNVISKNEEEQQSLQIQ